MTNSKNIKKLYLEKRTESLNSILSYFKNDIFMNEIIKKVFWSPAYTSENNEPLFFHPSFSKQTKHIEVLGFNKPKLEIENINNKYLRLPVSSNWILDLSEFKNFDEYFSLFSKKKRKNFRWLTNTYTNESFTISNITTEKDLDDFFSIYTLQFPNSKWLEKERKEALKKIFIYFEEKNLNNSYILKDKNNNLIASSLGFFSGNNLNFYMLARIKGKYDNLSPSNYLVLTILKELLDKNFNGLFLFGPGCYNYKKTFKGLEYPIYRYEPKSFRNIFGIIKLYNKCRKIKS